MLETFSAPVPSRSPSIPLQHAGERLLIIGGVESVHVDLTDQDGAKDRFGYHPDALIAVANQRAAIGAGSNRLQSAVEVMQSQAINTQAAESTIRDANMAQEISNLTKYQILSQTGMAALSQANAQSQSVMSLMRSEVIVSPNQDKISGGHNKAGSF